MSANTPANVAEHAAIPHAIPTDRLILLGIFHGAGGDSALLRGPQGEILQATTGQEVLGVTIIAIADDAVHVVDAAGTAHALKMPG